MRYFLILLFTLLTACLTACGSVVPTVKPFKMDIQQGNVVTSKMLLQLRPGMTKSQVKFIMGSPLLVDSFHSNRWDYFYQLRQAGKIVEQRRVILDFDKELLAKVRGDVVPEGTAGAATGNESAVAKTITLAPKPKQETSWADKLKFWKSDEPVKAEPAKDADKAPAALDAMREKTDATAQEPSSAGLQANSSAAAGDALINSIETPSVLAVPIGSVLAADAPIVANPTVETPTLEAPTLVAPDAPVAQAPVVTEAPVAAAIEPVAMPAAKAGERLIFRLDRNLNLNNLDLKNQDLKNIEAPIEAVPTTDNAATPKTAKPKKIESPPPPAEEAPGYFERMLEKIGF